jgi:UDP-N-acetylglucosamine 1-carboxyvinyltransferase
MQKLIVKGNKSLVGTVKISGSKNATLPILAAAILSNEKIELNNVPLVNDVFTMTKLLSHIGSNIKFNHRKKKILIHNKKKNFKTTAPYKLLKTMRAGVIVLGPLLSKFKRAKVSLPGGCAIGTRPVDIHLFGLKKLGAKIKIKNGYIIAEARNGLKGTNINLPSISVGATENVIIAASYANGVSYIKNCACEPEIKNLTDFLSSMGVKINWIGKRKVRIEGVQKLKPTIHKIMFDRIEAGTFIIAGALAAKNLKIKEIDTKFLSKELKCLKKMGVNLKIKKNEVLISSTKKIKPISINTEPYPGFPTDLQAQIMVLMTKASGISKIKENIFENRFMHVPELNRMGAKIKILGNTSFINGPQELNGAEVMATDLRASVSLVLAGLVAKNKTIINRVYHLDRGYEKIENKIKKCKGKISRVEY